MSNCFHHFVSMRFFDCILHTILTSLMPTEKHSRSQGSIKFLLFVPTVEIVQQRHNSYFDHTSKLKLFEKIQIFACELLICHFMLNAKRCKLIMLVVTYKNNWIINHRNDKKKLERTSFLLRKLFPLHLLIFSIIPFKSIKFCIFSKSP